MNDKLNNYFEKSRWWWYVKYAKPYQDRANLLVLCIVVVIFSVMTILASAQSVMKRFVNAIVINVPHDVTSQISVDPIQHMVNSNNINIAFFVVKKYIESYETYDASMNANYDFLQKLARMAKYSSKSIIDGMNKMYNDKYSKVLANGGFQKVQINRVYIEEIPENDTLANYFMPAAIPDYFLADITLYLFDGENLHRQTRTAKVSIDFNPITDTDGAESEIKYTISSYEYI